VLLLIKSPLESKNDLYTCVSSVLQIVNTRPGYQIDHAFEGFQRVHKTIFQKKLYFQRIDEKFL